MPNMFVNTIAYNRWSDFKLLSNVANQCSGVCVQALKIKDVYDALRNTADLLAGQVQPAVSVPVGDATYQAFVSKAGVKVIGSASDLVVKGVSPEHDQTVWQFMEVSEAEYNASNLPVAGDGNGQRQGLDSLYAFARCQLAEGNLNAAKYALISTRNQTLIDKHAKALTNEELAALCTDIDICLFGNPSGHRYTYDYGLDTSQASVLLIVGTLAQYARNLKVDVADLRSHYQKRGVKRVPGKRLDDGSIEKPWLRTRYKSEDPFVQVQAFELNRNNATINMRVIRPVDLVNSENGTEVSEVMGISLDNLNNYNNYTIVGDGSLNLSQMNVRIDSKKAYKALADIGVLSGDFDPTATYTIDFTGRPLVDYVQSFNPDALDGVFRELAGLKVLESIFGAMTKGTSEHYTSEQIAELKRHYLSPALYISFPTTTEYADLQAALSNGSVDTRLSYKVDIGDTEVLSLGKLHSANKFIDRMFTIEVNGEKQKKATWPLLWESGAQVDYKVLSSRTKLTAVDDLMKPIYEDFLALDDNGKVREILATAGVADLADGIRAWAEGKQGQDATVEVFAEAKRAVSNRIEALFNAKIRPLVFYVGATGLVPDEFNAKALPADALTERHPLITLAKAEQDGTFFPVGNHTILSVYVKSEHFSTGRGGDAAAAK